MKKRMLNLINIREIIPLKCPYYAIFKVANIVLWVS